MQWFVRGRWKMDGGHTSGRRFAWLHFFQHYPEAFYSFGSEANAVRDLRARERMEH